MDFISLLIFALKVGEGSMGNERLYSKRRRRMQTTKRHKEWTIDEPPGRQRKKLRMLAVDA